MSRAFAISDIHGCIQTFRALVEVIQLKREDTLYLLGDYIDRGPDSKGVIDFILYLKQEGFHVITLRGNHEQMLLDALSNPLALERFLVNGGDKTMASFGISRPVHLDVSYLSFFNSLEYHSTFKNIILVHAGLNGEISDPLEDKEAMLWIRRFKIKPSFNKIVVHGHTPVALESITDMIENREKGLHIDIDNGCVYGVNQFYGNLCCLDLNTFQLYKQPNIDFKPLF